MIRTLVLGLVVLGLVAAPPAAGYVERSPIGENTAKQMVTKYLRKFPGWRYREDGFIDCYRGRINRNTWGCRVAWWSGNRCRHGRVRIMTEYAERGTIYYAVNYRSVPCWR